MPFALKGRDEMDERFDGIDALAVVGAVTVVFGGMLAFVQDDIKKVLAYSTISQLGYMVLALGVVVLVVRDGNSQRAQRQDRADSMALSMPAPARPPSPFFEPESMRSTAWKSLTGTKPSGITCPPLLVNTIPIGRAPSSD